LRFGIISKLLDRWIVAPPVPENIWPTDWIPGASMIIRCKTLQDIGLMDEKYFMYYEDSDFCLKAKKHGWSCWYVPTSRVIHLVGQSSQINHQQTEPKRRPQYWFNSRQRYFVKNHGWWYAILVDLVWIISFSIWKLRSFIQRRPNYDPPHFFRDFLRHSIFLKGV
jgi:GT2 family glycosyltransferase